MKDGNLLIMMDHTSLYSINFNEDISCGSFMRRGNLKG